MSVAILDAKEAIAFVVLAHHAGPPVTRNFLNVFGTSGCLLNCEDERTLADSLPHNKPTIVIAQSARKKRRQAHSARNEHRAEFRKLRREWFTASEFSASALQGCGSCSILEAIIIHLFFPNEHRLPDDREFSVASNFEIRQRQIGAEVSPDSIRLFQHPGSNVFFERFAQSNFLLGKEQSIARMREWMHDCTSSHEICSQQSIVQNDGNRPTRLLDLTLVQQNGEAKIRLIETESDEPYHYACLSHRWDASVLSCRTTTENMLERLESLEIDQLPTNFREAVSIARSLNIDYLWIDSLCIIQDSQGDLLKELAKMGFIYQNAHLTIAAVSSPNSTDGCFMSDRWPDICMRIEHTTTKEAFIIGARVLDMGGQPVSTADFKSHYPLLTRGWVFQERLLSKRLLLCNYGEVAFECLERSCCECNSRIAPHVGGGGKGKGKSTAIRSMQFTKQRRLLTHAPTSADGGLRRTVLNYWRTIIETYMQLELSYASDVLPAIAGCAQLLSVNLSLTYVAGMWKELLSTDLLWYVRPEKRGAYEIRPADSMAPSWSWASVAMNQSITYGEDPINSGWLKSNLLLRDAIREVHCEPESATNPFGMIKAAYLKLDAILYPWYLRYFCLSARRDKGGNRGRAVDLHVRRVQATMTCTSHIPELELDHVTVEVKLDVRLWQEDLAKEALDHCDQGDAAPEHRCALTEIYLLPALHKENLPRATDWFLVLKLIAPVGERSNCYRRIGLMQILNEKAVAGRMWDDMIKGYIKPRREELWIF